MKLNERQQQLIINAFREIEKAVYDSVAYDKTKVNAISQIVTNTNRAIRDAEDNTKT